MTDIIKKSALILLGSLLVFSAAGCGEAEDSDPVSNPEERIEETASSESELTAPQFSAEECIELLVNDTDFNGFRDYFTVDPSTFAVIDSTLEPADPQYSMPASYTFVYQCSAFNKDQSLERIWKSEANYFYKDNQWEFYMFFARSELAVHHGAQFSDEELKPIVEACLGYEIDQIPEYTVSVSSLENTDDPYDEFWTEYCFYLVNEQYAYGGITHTLKLQFEAFENTAKGNDRIHDGGQYDWTLFDNGVTLSDPDADLNYDWITASMQLGGKNSLSFRFNVNSWMDNSLPDGYYYYGYNGNLSRHQLKSIHGIDMISPGTDNSYDPEKAATAISEFLMSIDFEWMYSNRNRAEAKSALMLGELYDFVLADADTGDVIPQSSIAIGFTDTSFALDVQGKAVKIPAIFLITYDGIYCSVPNAGIGGFTDDDTARVTTFSLQKMEVLEHGFRE